MRARLPRYDLQFPLTEFLAVLPQLHARAGMTRDGEHAWVETTDRAHLETVLNSLLFLSPALP